MKRNFILSWTILFTFVLAACTGSPTPAPVTAPTATPTSPPAAVQQSDDQQPPVVGLVQISAPLRRSSDRPV
jgi:hypothetical protein